MLNSLKPLSYLILSAALWSQYVSNCLVTNEEIENLSLLCMVSKTAPSNRKYNVSHVCHFEFSHSHIFKKWKEKSEINFNNIFYIT